MNSAPSQRRKGLLYTQLLWFIRLRWVAAVGVMLGALINWRWLGWYGDAAETFSVGAIILGYNAVLLWMLRTPPQGTSRNPWLLGLALIQIFLDLSCLTLLVMWTGGLYSPVAGFFVFHMVFASLLLPRFMAYASAAAAALTLVVIGLWATSSLPVGRGASLAFAGAALTLLLTVHLSNHITRSLRAHRRRLIRQNRRVRAMTEQLRRQQQALIQHEKMVAMGQMAAGVTHEIANPLASMDGILQLLERRPDRMKPETIATLREQVSRISQIVQQMKSFAHPAETERRTAALNDVVEESLKLVRFDHRIRRVRVERQYAAGVGELSILPQALEQVLVNLIINALDAMIQTPEPRLIVATQRQGEWCTIQITDNGCGIAPEHIDRLFEPFFTTKPVGKGTGLGLSISYSLVRRLGGNISVRSQIGQGTSFTLRLPAGDAPQIRLAATAPAAGK